MAKNCVTLKPVGMICDKCGNIYTTTPAPFEDDLWHVAGCPQCGFGDAFFTKTDHDGKPPCGGHEKA